MVKHNVSKKMTPQAAVNSALTQASTCTRYMKLIFIIIITHQNITNDNIYADADVHCTHDKRDQTVGLIAGNS